MWQPRTAAQPDGREFQTIHCFFFPRRDDVLEFATVLLHLGHGDALLEQGAGRAGVDALAARGAGARLAPRLVQVADDARADAAAREVLRPGPLDVPADPHAPSAQHASVVVHANSGASGPRRTLGRCSRTARGPCRAAWRGLAAHSVRSRRTRRRHGCARRRALEDHAPVLLQALAVRGHHHASATFVTQAGRSLWMPATSTRQSRHAPTSMTPRGGRAWGWGCRPPSRRRARS